MLGAACGSSDDGPVQRQVEVVEIHQHDPVLYTQGLEFSGGLLLESGGRRGESRLRVYDPVSGEVVAESRLDDALFAEGATVVGDEVWQLTWTSEQAFVYDLDDLTVVREVDYEGEGWGLCSFDDRFVMSNGSDELTFRRLDNFDPISTVAVRLDDQPVLNLNELECVAGEAEDGSEDRVFANVYQSNTIYGIDPNNGRITDVIDAAALVPPQFENDTELVLNGIALDPETGHFWITGKRWPVLYEVRISR